MIGKAIALSAMVSVLLLAAIGLPAQAAAQMATVSGTSPSGQSVSVEVGSSTAAFDVACGWERAGFTEVRINGGMMFAC